MRSVDDTEGNLFVFAGYLRPGRHQIIIKDPKSNTFWAKNIVVEMRKCEIL